MDHAYIEEQQIIAHYAIGKLAPAERLEFEEHLAGCRECQDEFELTDDFRGALRQSVLTRVPASTAPVWFGARQIAALSAAVLLVAACGLVVFFNQQRSFEGERRGWERRYASAQQARESAEAQLRAALSPGAAPQFTLNLSRGADAAAEPPNVVSIAPSTKSVVLSPEWQSPSEFHLYRAILTDAAGRSVWAEDAIPPPHSGALAITLSANLLPPGKYLLTLEGSSAGRYSIVGRYGFRVVASS